MERSVPENLSTRRSKWNGSTKKLETEEIMTTDKNISNSQERVISTPTRTISLRVDNPAGFQHRRTSNDTNIHGAQTKLMGEPNYSRNARRRSTFQEADLHAIIQRHRRASHARRRSYKKETAPQVKMCDRTPLEVFQKAVRMVIILTRAFRSIVRFAVEKGRHGEITDETTLSLKSMAGVRGVAEKLLFDPESYKCKYQVMLPQWAKRLTSKEPSRRRDKEIQALVRLMKQLKGFRRYSSEMQYAICKAIRYDCFSRRRVVIRKGHVAQRFYFIFSGSVCVTFDEDDYAAFNQPEDSDKSVLKKGDHFGELAFIRNLSRAATIVCLEKTELLSVDKEDFFNSGIDKSFQRGMENRVDFLCSRPMFSSWPEEIVRKIAQESKLQDYHSDEVIVRDSTTSAWLVFIVKGHADVLRLLDLSNCEEYAQHCHKYRRGTIEGAAERCISPSNRISPSSITSFGLPLLFETENNEDTFELIPPIASETHFQLKQRGAKADLNKYSRSKSAAPALALKAKAVAKFLKAGKRRKKGRVTFSNQEVRAKSGSADARRVSIEPIPEYSETEFEPQLNSGTPGPCLEKLNTEEVGVGVYMRLDRLGPGDCFGVWSLSNFENKKKKDRRFHLLSLGCEVIKVSKESFHKHSNETTMEKLKDFLKVYPSDATLCRTYLKQSDWKTYREELVDNLVVNHLAKLETAKGSARAHLVRASPVPPPLCSVKPWQRVNDKWEFFPNGGWAVGQVIKPTVEAGKPSRGTARDITRRLGQNLSRRSSRVSSRDTSCRTSLNSTPELTPQPGTQASRRTPPPIIPRASSDTLSPISTNLSTRRTKTPETLRVLPIVRNEEVLAKGSHRHLVLTQGGSRINERQIKVERKLLRYGDNRHFNLYSSKVS